MIRTLLASIARLGDAARACASASSWRRERSAAVAVCPTAITLNGMSLQPAYAQFGTKRHGRRPSKVLIT